MTRRWTKTATWLGLAAAAACGADEGGIAAGERVVTGRLIWETDSAAPGRPALQLAALWAAPSCGDAIRVGQVAEGVSACAIFGEPFDAGELGGGIPSTPFRLTIPCDLTVNVVVQTVGAGGGQVPGDILAVLTWPDGGGTTSLLPREPACRDTRLLATNVLDLGMFSVTDSGTEVLLGGPGGGKNPLATVDTDGDAIANLGDDDDDDDGVMDAADDDADGDGAADGAQRFTADWVE